MNENDEKSVEIVGPGEPEPVTAVQAARAAIAAAFGGFEASSHPLPWRVEGMIGIPHSVVSRDGRTVAVAITGPVARLIVEVINGAPAMLEELERQEREDRGLETCEICGVAGSPEELAAWHFDEESGAWFCPSCVAEHKLEEPGDPPLEHAPTLPCAAPVDVHDPNPLTPEPDANAAKVGA